MSHIPKALILCTGNSCRSQMAEGFLKLFAGARLSVQSAGTEPADFVHPMAIKVMAEKSVDISLNRPKHVDEFLGAILVRYLIIVCGGANETCPTTFPGTTERLFWPFDDPAKFIGTEVETTNEFRRVRDQIEAKIRGWLDIKDGNL